MPQIGSFHPPIVHFVIALLAVGVLFRLISLTGRFPFTGPAAAALLIAGTVGTVLAVKSGLDAHGPAERVPGARAAVVTHEDWGRRTRNVFLVVAALELAALAAATQRYHRYLRFGSALVGLGGGLALYEAAAHGGELVYSYAGGVGLRSGDSTDVGRLLVAGLYHEAMRDRREGKGADAARLIDELVRRQPDDPDVQFLRVESLIQDRKDGKAALLALAQMTVPDSEPRLQVRRGFLTADAYVALGQPDSARVVLERLAAAFPTMQRIKDRLARLAPRTSD